MLPMDLLAVLLRVALCLTVLVVQTCSSSSWAREVSYRPKRQAGRVTRSMLIKRQASCSLNQFRCTTGACIDFISLCDGFKECLDGSDETEGACKQLNIRTSAVPSGGCLLPYPPDFGSYTAPVCQVNDKTTVCRQVPGKPVSQNWLLSFKCDDGYYIKETQDNFYALCVNGKWSPNIPVCSKMCPSLDSLSVDIQCVYQGDNIDCSKPMRPGTLAKGKCKPSYVEIHPPLKEIFCTENGQWSHELFYCRQEMCPSLDSLSVDVECVYQGDNIDCSKPMRPGTRAKGKCKPSYVEIRHPPYLEIFCRENGQWSYALFYCDPVCGKRNVEGANKPLIVYGSTTKLGEFPWHAGLYMLNSTDQWEQSCGGTLISPHIVLIAAHCVFSEQTKQIISPSDIKVGLGKYYREWTHDEPGAVKSDVRAILVPSRYYGRATSYAHDIALLDLTFSVQINSNIMPVCVDWNLEFRITPGMLGTLAGWGKTENETSSDVLLYAQLPYIDYRHCIFEVPPVFRHYVTPDKFCAGFSNGTRADFGDSGGGLTFVQNDLHYVYGIVSTKVKGVKSFATFTNISNVELFYWLNDAKRTFDEMHLET